MTQFFDDPRAVPPDEVDMVECWACSGYGNECKAAECFETLPKGTKIRKDSCDSLHFCTNCKGRGQVPVPTVKEYEG